MQQRSALKLLGHVALLTGAESGIGAASAEALSALGAKVGICYFEDRAPAHALVEMLKQKGAESCATQCDVRNEASVGEAFAQISRGLGAPDILVNSAGLNQSGVNVSDMTLEQWHRVTDTDLTGAFLTSRQFIRSFSRAQHGRIINISSIHAEAARAGAAAYDSAKGGLLSLTRTLALECAPLQITVNAIAPGMILTPMNQRAVEDTAYRQRLERNVPLGRAGTAQEVAALVAYLCLPEASYITGASVTIDGGLSLLMGQGA